MAVRQRAGPFTYLYLPFGPSLAGEADLDESVVVARTTAQRRGCALVRVEPDASAAPRLVRAGARRVRSRQHQHTLRLRLDVDEPTLWSGLNSGHRSRINSAAKRGLSTQLVHDPGDIGDFISLLRQTEGRAGFYSHDDGYYHAIADELLPTGEASLYYAVAGGRRVAAALTFDYGATRYYAFAASDTEKRSLMPAPPLVWRTILDAREKGMRCFDFWGVAPPDQPNHSWAGITAFKRGFGGELHSRAGTWELTVRPLAARMFSLAQTLRR